MSKDAQDGIQYVLLTHLTEKDTPIMNEDIRHGVLFLHKLQLQI